MRRWPYLAAVLLGLVGCGDWTGYSVTLTNQSRQPITAISANFAGTVKKADRMIRGQFIVLASRGGEGGICLTFRQGGKLKDYAIDYISEGVPLHYQITVRDHDISVRDNDPIFQTAGEPRIHRSMDRPCVA